MQICQAVAGRQGYPQKNSCKAGALYSYNKYSLVSKLAFYLTGIHLLLVNSLQHFSATLYRRLGI